MIQAVCWQQNISHKDLIPPEKWNHVNGADNPANCASRGPLYQLSL